MLSHLLCDLLGHTLSPTIQLQEKLNTAEKPEQKSEKDKQLEKSPVIPIQLIY